MKETIGLGLIILLVGLLGGFGGGYFVGRLGVVEIRDTLRVEVPVQPNVAVLDTSRTIVPEIRYIPREDRRRVDSLLAFIDSLRSLAEDTTSDVVAVAVLDTTLTRVETLRDSTYAVGDTIHVEYVLPPVSLFTNLSVRPGGFVVPVDTVITREIATGSDLFHDVKVFVLGAGTAFAVVKALELLRGG